MDEKKLSELTDEQLLKESKKMKSNAIINAFFVGFLIGIVIYSVINNTWGFLMLIPLYMAYKLITKPDNREALDRVMKERNLK